MNLFRTLGRVGVTLAVVLVAGVVGWQMWVYYMQDPWTRDGRVRADVVAVAADVSGLVSTVDVTDNQAVKRGQLLFRIDPARAVLALRQAEAVLSSKQAAQAESEQEYNRYRSLNAIAVSQEKQQQTESAFQVAKAATDQASADRDLARLNVARTQVTASVNGIVTNVELRPGDYIGVGQGVMALVDTDSLHVDGYFEETKLPRIHIGDPVTIHLMGENQDLGGHVESVAGGIVDRERTDSASTLANVNPTFSWVRLAQRIPVRVAIDRRPEGVALVAGRTATVTVNPATPQVASR